MLISFKFNNFCSFNVDSEFSMEAPTGKVKTRFPDNYVSAGNGYDLLKTAVIVGENAGGKSNFIGSLKFLKGLFDNNLQVQSIGAYVNSSSLLSDKNPVQSFEVTFVASGQKVYKYALSIDSKGIVSEGLYKQSKRKATFITRFLVERGADGRYSETEGKTKELTTALKNSNNSYGLFVSKLALLGDEDAINVADWFKNILLPGAVPVDQENDPARKDEDIRIFKDKKFLDIFRMVDYSIDSVEVDPDKPYSKTLVIRKDADGNEIKRELQQDSTGVREFFAWAVQIFRVVYENRVVFADEMDRVLNPILSDRVVAFVNGTEHRGQFVFSTHNVLHLNLKTYMKEQIYFITKSKDSLTSEIYSLADFPDVRYETTKVYEFYMKGILGGTAFE
ncbi:ATP/GTP-binding protein [Butyrivibrio sp. INlla16]|uniref:AAA family ATPase n=1 Tax=Butyrivibrio sp. INlla16 TaxID=1520807 RepID=UPI000890E7C3|nr:ATP-binding protein [Butyrivibrio sp. INlla16]SDB51511.1 AAA domain-containing protein, putative AbiEii toxin, Type IV TA system [Butyrivibrio sp. INlla16]